MSLFRRSSDAASPSRRTPSEPRAAASLVHVEKGYAYRLDLITSDLRSRCIASVDEAFADASRLAIFVDEQVRTAAFDEDDEDDEEYEEEIEEAPDESARLRFQAQSIAEEIDSSRRGLSDVWGRGLDYQQSSSTFVHRYERIAKLLSDIDRLNARYLSIER